MSLHQEFENTEGEEYQADLSALASPSSQNGPEVYILPLTEVSLPVSKQPGRSSKKLHDTMNAKHLLTLDDRAVASWQRQKGFLFLHRNKNYNFRLNSSVSISSWHACIHDNSLLYNNEQENTGIQFYLWCVLVEEG